MEIALHLAADRGGIEMAIMTARYNGQCSECGTRVRAGTQIDYSKGTGARCLACASQPAVEPGPIELFGGSGYGCTGWTVGQVLHSDEERRRKGGPDGMVIVTVSKRYYREEGLSFGVGDDQGWTFYATARPATREELAPAIERAHDQALAVERAAEAERLERLFLDSGTWVEPEQGQIELEGEIIMVSSRGMLYGGGQWFVVEAEGAKKRGIWWVQNNGMDGDNWTNNNIRTGGAGAVGRRLPWSAELDRRVRSVREPKP